jgi:prepilin-type N-terminal cleavage/methylation domain-containing protein
MKKGFSLIEVIISLMITLIIMSLLYQAISQTRTSVSRIEYSIMSSSQLMLVQNQLEKDLSAVFVPFASKPLLSEKEKAKKEKKDEKFKEDNARQQSTDSDNKKSKDPLKRVVYATSENDNLKILSCITTNALYVYGVTTPRVVRILYTVRPDPLNEGLLIMVRQESTDLDFEAVEGEKANKLRSYTLMAGLKKVQMRFLLEKEPEKKNESASEKERVQHELVTVSEWTDEQTKEYKKLFPHYIECSGTLVDPRTQRESDFVWRFILYAYMSQDLYRDQQAPVTTLSAPGSTERVSLANFSMQGSIT